MLLLLACTPSISAPGVIPPGGAGPVEVDTGAGPAAPGVTFLDPGLNEVFTPEQAIRVEILAGDDGPLDTLRLVWLADAAGASSAPAAPAEDGTATFNLDPLPIGAYSVGVQVLDADGLGITATAYFTVAVLDTDGDGFINDALRGDDCDDADASVNPDATEVCDERDNDCDGRVDEGVTDPFWGDADGDAFGDPAVTLQACLAPVGYVANDTDCDDTNAAAWPDNPEVCDLADNDCDGAIDEGVESPFYRDDDSDGYGQNDDISYACSAPSGYVPAPGDCLDTDPTASPAWTEICYDGIDNDCDGTSNACGLGGTVDLGIADAKLRGAAGGDTAGASVSAGGDFDGDGLYDVLLGAPGADDGGTDAGGGYLFLGPVLGTLTTSSAAVSLVGATAGDGAGYAVASAGDVNADGFDDVLVGAWQNDGGGLDAGAAYLILGPDIGSFDLGASDLVMEGASAGDQAGLAVAPAGDIDGDGQADILVGAWGADAGGAYSGSVFLVNGPRTGTVDLSAADGELVGEASGDFAGQALAGAGDVNADGYDDVLVGAPGTDSGTGTAYLVFGPFGGRQSLAGADGVFSGVVEDDAAGASVAAAGDVNGDGAPDLLVGAYGYDYGGSATGAAFVLLGPVSGSVLLSGADSVLVGEHAGDNAGWSVAGAGDMDGDGDDDVLVGALREDSGGSAAGAAYLIYGPPAALLNLGSASARILGESTEDYAGASVAGVGDTDGDGKGDVLVGAPYEDAGVDSRSGAAYLVLGTGI